ncbi:glycosyltransferase family 4 protein [Ktedonospora formicarum]|uniref:Glycosyl transferase family 1 domain-containing protein n=1 Tax=Ktedonospora formicarum TaxID=2778364 RepID=A0A8J3MMR5_9CHLR|nr:glycosyltransferase family 4 protein [Ktedonospora formicarum]GHO41922.1 hypothetical protein KSX_00850 [Ktedonospora formicarum]
MSIKPRLLILGHGISSTGYGRVLSSICNRLTQKYTIFQIDLTGKGTEYDHSNWTMVPAQGVINALAKQQLNTLIEQFQPQLLFLCHDPWLYQFHHQELTAHRDTLKTIFYCPIEGPFRSPEQVASLVDLDALVLYTNYGRRLLLDAFAQLPQRNAPLPSIAVLPHGIDTELFFPLQPCTSWEERQRSLRQARQILFPHCPELQDACIFLNANYHRPRKRLDLTLRAFAEFTHATPGNIWLYLHVGEQEQKLLDLASYLGIRDRVLYTGLFADQRAVDDCMLNIIYNACDIGINTATSEGWGLVAFEHAATGAAQIVPAHSACQELWRDHGLLVPLQTRQPPHYSPEELQVGEIDISELASIFARLYHDRALRLHYSQQAYAHATASKFRWDTVAAHWDQLFQHQLQCVTK